MENITEKPQKKSERHGPNPNVILIAGGVITILLCFFHNIMPPFHKGVNFRGFLEFALFCSLMTAVLFLVSWLAYRKH